MAWPTVALIVIVTALALFHAPIARLIDRSDSVKTDLISIGKELDAQNTTTRAFAGSVVNDARSGLNTDLQSINTFPDITGGAIKAARETVLKLVLNASNTDKDLVENLLQFSAGTYATNIYAETFMKLRYSQIDALQFLLPQREAQPLNSLLFYYNKGKDAQGDGGASYPSFTDWTDEMVRLLCITVDNGAVKIGYIGEETITWSQRSGYSMYRLP